MTNSVTTFEEQLRERLLDIVHAQWHELGVPFSLSHPGSAEVIDPEALLWCSLEFLPTEPRLKENVLFWLSVNRQNLIRHRINRHAHDGDPRTNIWHVLDGATRRQAKRPNESCVGLASTDDVLSFCEKLEDDWGRRTREGRIGAPAVGTSTTLLRARSLLGRDVRHLLLVYLLANPGGSRLREIAKWAGYSYHSLAETADRWATVGVLKNDRGFCRLLERNLWRQLLRLDERSLVIVDWFTVFDATIRLLRVLGTGTQKDLALDGTVLTSFLRETRQAVSAAGRSEIDETSPALSHLLECI